MMTSTSPANAEIFLEACGRSWRLRRADMEALWEGMTKNPRPGWEQDERLPYWAELWPSSLALARWLEDNRGEIAGRSCLDMGCGLGFTALVGQWLGGRVIGMDYEEEALRFARENARLNGMAGVDWRLLDWRDLSLAPSGVERVWAGDIMYERAFAAPVAGFLAHVLAPAGMAWIAEPGRAVFGSLLEELPRHGLAARAVRRAETWPLNPQDVPVPVTVWEITREGG